MLRIAISSVKKFYFIFCQVFSNTTGLIAALDLSFEKPQFGENMEWWDVPCHVFYANFWICSLNFLIFSFSLQKQFSRHSALMVALWSSNAHSKFRTYRICGETWISYLIHTTRTFLIYTWKFEVFFLLKIVFPEVNRQHESLKEKALVLSSHVPHFFKSKLFYLNFSIMNKWIIIVCGQLVDDLAQLRCNCLRGAALPLCLM